MTPLVRDPAPQPAPLPARPPGARPPGAGAASLALRPLLDGPRAPRVTAAFPAAVYAEVRGGPEPRVLAVVASDAARMPNAVVVPVPRRDRPFREVREGADAVVGDGRVETGGFAVRVRREWDPAPVLGPLHPAALARGLRAVEAACVDAGMTGGGLAGHPDPDLLAARCAAGDLAGAVEAAERIVGLGPGLTPSGDDILCGLLVALRLSGRRGPARTGARCG
ncbi:hypothetical protein BJF79_43005, partial [Actinomadura sp. CNU-125]|uniref:oxamate carbamoyltransferase subunit AllH family protein n=1 Tax=Actinomadura sp. CNU-125 TaxID=1904961 RepID=UPI000968D4BB